MLPEGKEGPWRKERPYSALVPGQRRTGCPSAAHRPCPRLILPHRRKRKPAEAHQEPLGIHGGQGTDPPAQAPSPGHVMGSRALIRTHVAQASSQLGADVQGGRRIWRPGQE